MQAVSDTILQPTLAPLRPDVGSFLFHGYDPASVVEPYRRAREAAAAAWTGKALRRHVRRQQLAALGAGPPVPRRLRPVRERVGPSHASSAGIGARGRNGP